MDPAFRADPYPAYAWLRENEPVHFHARTDRTPSYWALSRFEDVWDAVRRPGDYSSASGLTFFDDEIGELGLAPTIVMMDPPRQTQLRGLIGRAFTPRRVADLEATIRAFVRGRVAVLLDGGADLHRDFSAPVPTFVLAELLGVPEADRARFGPWVSVLTGLQNDGFAAPGRDAVTAVAEMFEYFSAVIADRRTHPRDDLIGALARAEVVGDDGRPARLSDWDILGFCFVMVAGGNDTTASLISHGVALLTDAPEQRKLLLDDPALVEGAVLEFLRLEGSVQGLCRTTTRPVVVHNVEIPAGEKVLMLYAAANRDPDEFGPSAEELDVRRTPPRHLGFSSGPHFCIGNHLARLQAQIAFEELLAAIPDVAVDLAAGVRHDSAFVRGWVSLPVTSSG
jgi:cytochrome P450